MEIYLLFRFGTSCRWLGRYGFWTSGGYRKIIYTPRGDGNTIGIEMNMNCSIDRPSLGLFRKTNCYYYKVGIYRSAFWRTVFLRNLTRGKEERIFTYVDGEQVFW